MPRVREAGDSTLIVEFGDRVDLDVNARVLATAARLRAAAWPGVRDVVPTCRSVAVAFDPLRTGVADITDAIRRYADGPVAVGASRTVEVPVEYGGAAGPDLEEVAAGSRLSPAEVIARHASQPYRVFMLGFLPGFAYLGPVDPSIHAPRRSSPRRRVPPGSVAIAGGQTGIYPQASPGGWQIVGRTTLRPFVASRTPAALLLPGDTVRFVPAVPGSLGAFDAVWAEVPSGEAPGEAAGETPSGEPLQARSPARGLTVLNAGLMTTVQDGGRWGHQHEGVPVSGAMDLEALRQANAAIGHPRAAAALEATLSGLELRMDHAGAVAIAGADLGATLDGRPVPLHERTSWDAGALLRLTGRVRGARAYIAFDGAIDVAPSLGSRATDMTSGLGGRRLRAGDRLALGPPVVGSIRRRPAQVSPVPSGGARVRVLPGPHDEWFSPDALALLQRTRFELTPESNRMGYRLHGPQPVPRDPREMISDATCAGGLQVPPSGQPILLMADRQVTGGYPIIATVITADLPMAGQLAPGDWIEFELCTRVDAIRALEEQERAYGAAQ